MTGFRPRRRGLPLALGSLGLVVLLIAIRPSGDGTGALPAIAADQAPAACSSCDARHQNRSRIAPATAEEVLP